MTAFFAERPESLKLWPDLLGETPEIQNVRRNENIVVQEGPYNAHRIRCVLHPPRIDWLLFAPARNEEDEEMPEQEAQQPEFPFDSVGAFDAALEKFVPLMHQWLENNTSIQRLAFGAILLQPVVDRPEGYRRLQEFLRHVRLNPERSSDFLYQINWPRESESGIEDLTINRLSKWLVAYTQRRILTLDGIGRPTASAPASQPVYFACRLELDMNTSQHFEVELPKEKLRTVFDELIAVGKEIATQGEVE